MERQFKELSNKMNPFTKEIETIKKWSKNSDQKENDNSPETNTEDTETYNLNGREFKIAIIRKLNDLQENTERQFKEFSNKMNVFTKKIENHKEKISRGPALWPRS